MKVPAGTRRRRLRLCSRSQKAGHQAWCSLCSCSPSSSCLLAHSRALFHWDSSSDGRFCLTEIGSALHELSALLPTLLSSPKLLGTCEANFPLEACQMESSTGQALPCAAKEPEKMSKELAFSEKSNPRCPSSICGQAKLSTGLCFTSRNQSLFSLTRRTILSLATPSREELRKFSSHFLQLSISYALNKPVELLLILFLDTPLLERKENRDWKALEECFAKAGNLSDS